MAVVQSLIDTNWVAPAVFAAMTLALLLLALYLGLWATLEASYVRGESPQVFRRLGCLDLRYRVGLALAMVLEAVDPAE